MTGNFTEAGELRGSDEENIGKHSGNMMDALDGTSSISNNNSNSSSAPFLDSNSTGSDTLDEDSVKMDINFTEESDNDNNNGTESPDKNEQWTTITKDDIQCIFN